MTSLRKAAWALGPVAVAVACASTPNDGSQSSESRLVVVHVPTLSPPPPIDATHSVLTQHNDPHRDGAYTTEGTLKPANVKGANPSCLQQAPLAPAPGAPTTTYDGVTVASNCYSTGFGEIAVRPMVGDMAAQPLYAHGVTTTRGVRNLAIAATRENYLYAFDADNVESDQNIGSYTVWSGQIVPGLATLEAPIFLGYGAMDNAPCSVVPGALSPPCPNAIPRMVVPSADPSAACGQTAQHVGITSTPVIDPSTGYMYVVYRTGSLPSVEPVLTQYWLRAINLANGSAVTLPNQSSPDVLIQGSDISGTGGEVVFNPVLELNRPGLLLQDDPATGHPILYVAFGSAACDRGGDPQVTLAKGPAAYFPLGWVFAYDLSNMQSAAFSSMRDDPQKYGDTIWQSGNGLLGDGEYVYFFTGNATTTSNAGAYSGGLNEALVKLQAVVSSASSLKLNFVSHWQDPDAQIEDEGFPDPTSAEPKNTLGADADLGAAGPMIVPGTNVIAGGGKPGTIFTFDPTPTIPVNLQTKKMAAENTYCNLAQAKPVPGVNCSVPPDVSSVCPCTLYDTTTPVPGGYALAYEEAQNWGPNIHVGLVGWQSTSETSYIYSMAEKDWLRSYPVSPSGVVSFAAPIVSPVRSDWGMPGGHLSVSGNGNVDGIVWALHYEADDKNPDMVDFTNGTKAPSGAGITSGTYNRTHGVLYALDAVNLGLLYKDDAFHSEVPTAPGNTPGTCAPGAAGTGCGQMFAKFTPPTIADGKVFRPTYTGTLAVMVAPQTVATGTYTGELFVYGQNSIAPTVVSNSRYGEMVAFEVDNNRTLWFAMQSAPSSAFGAWHGVSGNVKSSPAALDLGNGQVEVYFVSGNNGMFCAVGTGTSPVFAPQSPDGMVGQFNYSPTLVKNPSGAGNLVFAVTTTGEFVYSTDNAACGIGGWQALAAGPYTSTPAVGKNANGQLEVFLLDKNGAMWSIAQSGTAWGSPVELAGATDFASAPVVGYEQNREMVVFAVDAGGGLRHIWQTSPSGAFTAWSTTSALLGAPFSTPPAIASNADGTIEILAIDANGNFQRQRETGPNTETWAAAWETLSIGCTSAPAIGHNADGRLEAFAICPDQMPGATAWVWGLKHTWQMTTVNELNEFAPGPSASTTRYSLYSLSAQSWPPWQSD